MKNRREKREAWSEVRSEEGGGGRIVLEKMMSVVARVYLVLLVQWSNKEVAAVAWFVLQRNLTVAVVRCCCGETVECLHQVVRCLVAAVIPVRFVCTVAVL